MTSIRLIAVIAAVAALYFGAAALIPFVLGYFLFALLEPMVAWCEPRGLARGLSSVVLVSASLVVTVLIVWSFYAAFAAIAKDVPSYSKKLQGMASAVINKAQTLEKNTSSVVPKTEAPDDVQKVQIVQGYGEFAGFALKGIGSVFEAMAGGIFIPLIGLFFLMDKIYLKKTFLGLVGLRFNLDGAGKEIYQMVRGFFVGNLIIGAGTAACFTGLYMALGLKNALPLGLATGFLNLIPFAGAIFSLIFPLAQGLLQFNSVGPFLIITLVVIFVHLTVANVVVPKVVGSSIHVNILAATVALLFWGWVWGAIGLLLGVPLIALVKIILKNYEGTYTLSLLIEDHLDAQSNKPSFLRRLFTKSTHAAPVNQTKQNRRSASPKNTRT